MHTIVPGAACGLFGSGAMGTEKRAGIGAMSCVSEVVSVEENEEDLEESE